MLSVLSNVKITSLWRTSVGYGQLIHGRHIKHCWMDGNHKHDRRHHSAGTTKLDRWTGWHEIWGNVVDTLKHSITYHACGSEIPNTCFHATSTCTIIHTFVFVLSGSPSPWTSVWTVNSDSQGAEGGLDFNLTSIVCVLRSYRRSERSGASLPPGPCSLAWYAWYAVAGHIQSPLNNWGLRTFTETPALNSVHSVAAGLTACVVGWLIGKHPELRGACRAVTSQNCQEVYS
jgi:hypothetical protein